MSISSRSAKVLVTLAFGGLTVNHNNVVAEQQKKRTTLVEEGKVNTKPKASPTTENICNEGDETCRNDDGTNIENNDALPPLPVSECGVWFAKSTIPGAGYGIFAGRDFKKDEQFLPRGDVVIPIVDIVLHVGYGNFQFLWDEYTWDSTSLWMDHEGFDEVNGASPGFGAAANCFLDMINADEATQLGLDPPGGLHRSKDPGAGASTMYHNRIAWAQSFVEAGQELFVNYGQSWFESRPKLGNIPLNGDQRTSQKIMNAYKQLDAKHRNTIPQHILTELWDDVVIEGIRNDFPSRTLSAMPDLQDKDEAFEVGLKEMRRRKTMRTSEYFAENGTCLDHLAEGESKIPQAGRGAFAQRILPKGSIVAPMPLIHLIDRDVLNMFPVEFDENDKPVVENRSVVETKQLLLNYCMGHPESTMILCPYGSNNMLINHSSERPNVKLRWGSTKRTNHEPEWLEKPVTAFKFKATAVLAFELVATREIWPGEEILLDYGQEWAGAWNEHVANWKPVDGADAYVSAYDLNTDMQTPLKTVFEEEENPYPDNVELYFRGIFRNEVWRKRNNITRYIETHFDNDELFPCEILRYKRSKSGEIGVGQGNFLYAALIQFDGDDKDETLMEDLPKEAFLFLDKPGTTDPHLPNTFRHYIGIPDDIFPEAWKNINEKLTKNK